MADDRKDGEATIKVASKKNPSAGKMKVGSFKLKEKIPKIKDAGDYDKGHVVEDQKKAKASAAANRATSPTGTAVNHLDDLPHETFTKGLPLVDSPALTSCKWCKKSILMTTAVEHINGCLKIKKEKANRKKAAREARERAKEQAAREERERRAEEEGIPLVDEGDSGDDDENEKPTGGKSTKKVASKRAGDGDVKGKKRKADGDVDKGPKQKKKKDEPKPKTKPKGPVDVERQCGVLLPNGQPCARSLTCKSHSMGAKRAVAGRSLPYDMLLAAYQKKNQARQQKAALDANAPIEEDDDPNAGPVDSDEEYNAVMSALKKWNPQPVVPQPQLNFLKRETQLVRLRHAIDAATDNGRKNIFKVKGYGAQRLPPGHPGHRPPVPILPALDQEDAPGEEEDDVPMMGSGVPSSARSATFAPIPQGRQVSVGGA
ncbi:SCA7, zinc-binding domain-domain-containing protein [Coniella lustricola]|uniref:SCA7, zinc-binding domain-domain-containing protein n=1 Tax=Coniella lustricola TaxID=2025994 RepID=A0A2T3ABA6_9PEZI|nr:SCA7, zinc-binding domain-domain-containing protein [Coniella lustricola]